MQGTHSLLMRMKLKKILTDKIRLSCQNKISIYNREPVHTGHFHNEVLSIVSAWFNFMHTRTFSSRRKEGMTYG